MELVNGTYVNLDADQIFEKNTVRALTTVKMEPPDTENESDEEEGDGSGLWNGNEEKRSGGGWWKSVKRQWNGAKKRSNDNFIVSSRIDCESQIEEGAVQGGEFQRGVNGDNGSVRRNSRSYKTTTSESNPIFTRGAPCYDRRRDRSGNRHLARSPRGREENATR